MSPNVRDVLTSLGARGLKTRWFVRAPIVIYRAGLGFVFGSRGERELFPAFLYVYVDDADDAYRRALDAGAVSLEEPLDTPYGDRRAMVRDPFGNVFQIAHRRNSTDS